MYAVVGEPAWQVSRNNVFLHRESWSCKAHGCRLPGSNHEGHEDFTSAKKKAQLVAGPS